MSESGKVIYTHTCIQFKFYYDYNNNKIYKPIYTCTLTLPHTLTRSFTQFERLHTYIHSYIHTYLQILKLCAATGINLLDTVLDRYIVCGCQDGAVRFFDFQVCYCYCYSASVYESYTVNSNRAHPHTTHHTKHAHTRLKH